MLSRISLELRLPHLTWRQPASHTVLKDARALQVLPLKGMTQVATSVMGDGSVLLASGSEGTIRRLIPIPFSQQAESLADSEEFPEALQLASYIPDSNVRCCHVLKLQ